MVDGDQDSSAAAVAANLVRNGNRRVQRDLGGGVACDSVHTYKLLRL